MRYLLALVACATLVVGLSLAGPSFGDEKAQILTTDHIVKVKSTAPAIAGQTAAIYVRERRKAGSVPKVLTGRVALFVHGAGTPAEVAFDVPFRDFSWMEFLARAGFDVFAVDMTGYGRSVRPAPMNDPCNLAAAAQAQFIPSVIKAPCTATSSLPVATLASDWNDLGATVDYIRALRHVDKVDLLGWSMGGPRAAGYAAQHADKVEKMVLLAPAYNRGPQAGAAAAARGARGAVPAQGGATAAPGAARATVLFGTQSRDEFIANWDRQAPCDGQYEAGTRDAVWGAMLASNPVGAKWGTGVRRAPSGGGGAAGGSWTQAMAKQTEIPTLMVSGVHDGQVNPQAVRNLFEDLGAKQKVFIDLACSSHNAMWEKNHTLLFQASLDWLTQTTVQGTQNGMIKLGY